MMDSLSDQNCIKRFSPQSLRPLQSTLNQFYSYKVFFYFIGKVKGCQVNISRKINLADAMDTGQAGAKLEQEKIEKWFAFVNIYILHCTYTQWYLDISQTQATNTSSISGLGSTHNTGFFNPPALKT